MVDVPFKVEERPWNKVVLFFVASIIFVIAYIVLKAMRGNDGYDELSLLYALSFTVSVALVFMKWDTPEYKEGVVMTVEKKGITYEGKTLKKADIVEIIFKIGMAPDSDRHPSLGTLVAGMITGPDEDAIAVGTDDRIESVRFVLKSGEEVVFSDKQLDLKQLHEALYANKYTRLIRQDILLPKHLQVYE